MEKIQELLGYKDIITIDIKNVSLSSVSERVNDTDDSKSIINSLMKHSLYYKEAICLSAKDIGINKRIGIVNIIKPIIFINPEIIGYNGELDVYETSISFPNQVFHTDRFVSIVVTADNFKEPIRFGFDASEEIYDGHPKLTEVIAIQQMIDNMNGIDITKKTHKNKPFIKVDRYNRNDLVTVTNGVETLNIKYKRLDEFKSNGYKVLEN